LIIALVLGAAALTRSALGFGDALVSMPLLSLLLPLDRARPLVALLAGTTALTILARDWRLVRFTAVWRLVLGAVVGIPIGAFFLHLIDEQLVKVILSLLIITFSLYNLFRPKLTELKSERLAVLFGVISGTLGGAYNTFGPPVVIYGTMRRWPAENFRASVQCYFVPCLLTLFAVHIYEGLWVPAVFRDFALSLPVIFVAIYAGTKLHRRLADRRFDRYVSVALLFVAGMLLFSSLGGAEGDQVRESAPVESAVGDGG
jgi:hypothetical protein